MHMRKPSQGAKAHHISHKPKVISSRTGGAFRSISVSALGGGFLGSSLGLVGTAAGLVVGGLVGAWANKDAIRKCHLT